MNIMSLVSVACFLVSLGAVPAFPQEAGMPAVWINQGGVRVYKIPGSNAYHFRTAKLSFDADGAPNAYHPDSGRGLDKLANAGYPCGGWRNVLVADPRDCSKPYVQMGGKYSGFFVSKTSLFDASIADETDYRRYVDSSSVPYFVFPGDFLQMRGTGRMGDFGLAFNADSKRYSWFVIADTAKSGAPLGEVSLKLASALGGKDPNPRNGQGGPDGETVFVIFPYSNSTKTWPVSQSVIEQFVLQAKGEEWVRRFMETNGFK